MYLIAIIGDLFSFIPLLNIVTNPITAAALWMAGADTKYNIFSQNYILGTLVTLLIEFVPGLSMIPTWTIRVWLMKRRQRKSEAEGREVDEGGGDAFAGAY